MRRLLSIWRRHPWLTSAFALAGAVTLYFAVQTVLHMIYWADPRHRDQAIEPWMTPGYVAMSWDVPRAVMKPAIGPLPERQRPTLEAIAAEQGISLDDLIARIGAAIAAHRAQE